MCGSLLLLAPQDNTGQVDVAACLANLKKFGVDELVALCRGDLKTGSRLLNNKTYSALYTSVCLACTNGMASDDKDHEAEETNTKLLYEAHSRHIADYLDSDVEPDLARYTGEYLLSAFTRHWERHKVFSEWMRRCFMYLDRRGPFNQDTEAPSLTSSAMILFKRRVFDHQKGRVLETVQDFIERERTGASIDQSLLKSVIELFIVMGVAATVREFKKVAEVERYARRPEAGDNDTYRDDFETPFLERTRQFYRRKSQEWAASDSTPAYLAKAEAALQAEVARVALYLNPGTEPKLLRVVEQELLEVCMPQLLRKEGSGLAVLLRDDKRDDMACMFRLFRRVDGLEPMAALLEQHVRVAGEAIVAARIARVDEAVGGAGGASAAAGGADAGKAKKKKRKARDAHDPEFVDALIALHARSRSLVDEQFERDTAFQKAHGRAFRHILSKEPASAALNGEQGNADVLACYCDHLLRKARAKLTQGELETSLEAVVSIFDYLADQDLFAEFYREKLARRLLEGKSVLDDEKRVVSSLKLRCGAQFTHKMEGMFNDLELGEEAQRAYSDEWARAGAHADSAAGRIENFAVSVLKVGYWPTFVDVAVTPPEAVHGATRHFVEYYARLESKKRLTWVYTQGNATIRAVFAGGAWKQLNVTTLQMCLLLAFNSSDEWSFSDLASQTGMELEVLKRVAHPLHLKASGSSAGKKKKSQNVLEKVIGTGGAGDKLRINEGLAKHPARRLAYPAPTLAPSKARERVDVDRRFCIDAAIVRIMKARRTLTHTELMSEVLSQLTSFRAVPKAVKERIEDLIHRDYLARNAGAQPASYSYLA